jgi:hypothetical protein
LACIPLYFFSFYKARSCIFKEFFYGVVIRTIRSCVRLPSRLLNGVQVVIDTKDSIWWMDVLGIGRGVEVDWFKSNVSHCVDNGYNIGCWKFKLFGNQPFNELFSNLSL